MRCELLSQTAGRYLGFAKHKLKMLSRLRLSANLPIVDKLLTVDNHSIFIRSSRYGDVIRISGGISFPLILLSNRVESRGYNYLSGDISPADILESLSPLNSLYDSRCQFGDSSYAKLTEGIWTSGGLDNSGRFLGYIPGYDVGVFVSGNSIFSRNALEKRSLLETPQNHMPGFSGGYGPLFYTSCFAEGENWNQFDGLILLTYSPESENTTESWSWVPNMFTVYPGESGGSLFPGWYYGGNLQPRYGYDEENEAFFPLLKLNVELKAVMDTRRNGSGYAYGWCEEVQYWETEVEQQYISDLHFFFSKNLLSTNFDGYQFFQTTNSGLRYRVTVGSTLSGNIPTFIISDHGMDSPNVSMWSFNSFRNDNDDTNAVGIVVYSGNQAKVYRYKGYLSTVASVNNYHSHHVSANGQYVAVFTGDTIIDGVKVYDLFGTKSDGQYVAGGWITLGVDTSLSSLGMTEGVLINFKEADFAAKILTNSNIAKFPAPIKLRAPALAQLDFTSDGYGPCQIRKITSEDGVKASFEVTNDDCFESHIIVDDPSRGINQDKLVGAWNFGGSIVGVVRGDFTGSGDVRRFRGIGRGDISKITLNKTILLDWTHIGGLDVQIVTPIVGDLIYGSGFNSDGSLNFDTARIVCNPPAYRFELSSTCGQEGSIDYEADELTLTGPSAPEPDDVYVAAGGLQPYHFTFTDGTIDQAGKILTVDSCGSPGVTGVGKVTVTDACGTEASIDVMLLGGHYTIIGAREYAGGSFFVCGGGGSERTVDSYNGIYWTRKNYCVYSSSFIDCSLLSYPCCNNCTVQALDADSAPSPTYATVRLHWTENYVWGC